ncbi:hypothetical protein CerSpe_047540 [Prunus speciosa]
MELLAIGLGVDRMLYREFFEDAVSIMRTNLYPTCQEPNRSHGTGPHCDPNALTILHQDLVGGLDLFVDNKWHKVRPIPGALVINIGDVFANALSNGIYRSCLHRAVVNSHKERRSLVFFMCPRADKLVKPAKELVRTSEGAQESFWISHGQICLNSLKTITELMKLLSKTSPTGSFLLIIPIPNPPNN